MPRDTRKNRRTAGRGSRSRAWSTSWECGGKSIWDCCRKIRPSTGDWVLIHVGFAMSKISEEDALDQLRMLTDLGESEAAMEEVQGYGLGEWRRQRTRPARESIRRSTNHEICR